MSQLKKLASDTAVYGASSIVGRMLNYLLVPYYTGVFVASEYGVVTEFYAYAAFFNVLYTYGLETAYFRFASKDKTTEKSTYSIAVTSILLSTLVLSGSLLLFSSEIASTLGYPDKQHYVSWFALIFAIDAIVAIPFAKLRYDGKARLFAISKLVNILLNIGLNLFFITFCKGVYEGQFLPGIKQSITHVYNPDFGVEYVFLSNLIANAALLILLRKELFKVRISLNWAILKPMLKYAYPLLFTGLAYVTNEMLSRWAIKYWTPESLYPGQSNLEILGIFGAVYKLSIFMTLGIQAFRYAAEPFFFSNAETKESPELFSKVMHWFVIFGCFVLLAVSINLDLLQFLLRREEYRTGLYVVPILLLANLFLGVFYNLSVWYKLTDRTHFGTWITIFGAILTIALNYILIPQYGYLGSSIVTLVTYILMTAVSYYLGRKYYPVPYKALRAAVYIILTAAVTYTVLQIDIANQLIATMFHLGILIIFVLAVFIFEKVPLPRKTGRFS